MNKTSTNESKNSMSTSQSSHSCSPSSKRYDDAFKCQTVEHWIKTGKSGRQIAREIGVAYSSLKDWKRRYYGNAIPKRDDMAAEIRALRAELARVTEQRNILKKTLSIFSQPQQSATSSFKK